jgi:hypothetical protein
VGDAEEVNLKFRGSESQKEVAQKSLCIFHATVGRAGVSRVCNRPLTFAVRKKCVVTRHRHLLACTVVHITYSTSVQ